MFGRRRWRRRWRRNLSQDELDGRQVLPAAAATTASLATASLATATATASMTAVTFRRWPRRRSHG